MNVRQSLLKLWKNSRILERWSLGLTAIALLVGTGISTTHPPLFEQTKGIATVVLTALFLYGTVPTTVRCGTDTRMVWTVCGASVVEMLITLTAFYIAFFWIVPTPPSPSADRILNLPPVLAALWAAGMGWYVHFQASSKNHRTTNSFNLVMQTRTSAEFIENARRVQATFPYGHSVPEAEQELMSSRSLLAAQESLEAALSGGVEAEIKDARQKAKRVKAIASLGYLLNYYEFMAVGIKAKDLDEEMLYQTLGVTVTSIYSRAGVCITHLRASAPTGGGQPLAFEHLGALVKTWEGRLKDDIHALK